MPFCPSTTPQPCWQLPKHSLRSSLLLHLLLSLHSLLTYMLLNLQVPAVSAVAAAAVHATKRCCYSCIPCQTTVVPLLRCKCQPLHTAPHAACCSLAPAAACCACLPAACACRVPLIAAPAKLQSINNRCTAMAAMHFRAYAAAWLSDSLLLPATQPLDKPAAMLGSCTPFAFATGCASRP